MIDFSDYKTPVNIIASELRTNLDEQIMQAIQKVGIDVDRAELIKAMNYDRGQFEKGFKSGYNKAVDDTVKAIKEEYAFTILEEEKIDKIAEQLKGVKQNDD